MRARGRRPCSVGPSGSSPICVRASAPTQGRPSRAPRGRRDGRRGGPRHRSPCTIDPVHAHAVAHGLHPRGERVDQIHRRRRCAVPARGGLPPPRGRRNRRSARALRRVHARAPVRRPGLALIRHVALAHDGHLLAQRAQRAHGAAARDVRYPRHGEAHHPELEYAFVFEVPERRVEQHVRGGGHVPGTADERDPSRCPANRPRSSSRL